jgi:hypothetical protein
MYSYYIEQTYIHHYNSKTRTMMSQIHNYNTTGTHLHTIVLCTRHFFLHLTIILMNRNNRFFIAPRFSWRWHAPAEFFLGNDGEINNFEVLDNKIQPLIRFLDLQCTNLTIWHTSANWRLKGRMWQVNRQAYTNLNRQPSSTKCIRVPLVNRNVRNSNWRSVSYMQANNFTAATCI